MRAVSLFLGLLTLVAGLTVAPKAEAFTYIQRFGCPGDTGAAWPANLLPSRWHIQRSAYSQLPVQELIEVLDRSISAWGEAWGSPCCSGFSHELVGFTDQSPLDSEGQNVVGFAETSWPRYLGSRWAVIAVTLPEIQVGSCELRAADMLFNGSTFVFRTDGRLDDHNAVDLESIAVHEFGHWIGLDHSVDPTSPVGYLTESVMFPTYRGGIDDRELYLDDKLGACALYPVACGSCQEDRDCPEGRRCQNGSCQRVGCSRDVDCPLGSVCGDDGRCHRGCRLHAECGEGFYCADGACIPDLECHACQPCSRSRDCGGDYFCLEIEEGVGVCSKYCTSDAECGGDSRCHIVQQGIGVCGAPDPNTFCPVGYRCSDLSCPDLGSSCSNACGTRSDTCVEGGSGKICSCSCNSDRDCDGGRCLENPMNGVRSCYPADGVQRCGDTFCPPGSTCEDGSCFAVCNGTRCEAGEYCDGGRCTAPCPSCPAGEVCDPLRRSCVIEPSCLGVVCESGKKCVAGSCHTACGDEICENGEVCRSGKCVDRKDSEGGCSAGEGGLGLAPALLFLALHAAARAARRNA